MRNLPKNSFRIFIQLSLGIILFSACHSSKKTSSSSAPEPLKAEKKANKKEDKKKIERVIKTAYSFKGTPYKLGGMDKHGMDCSGLVNISYKEAGVKLPRTTSELLQAGKPIRLNDAKKGDLLFFSTDKKRQNHINHVGMVSRVEDKDIIYFIHASYKLGVTEDNLSQKYYKEAFQKAIRPRY